MRVLFNNISKQKYYILSSITILFQMLFLAVAKEFETEFLKYVEIIVISQTIITFFGSIQFYIKKKKFINIQIDLRVWVISIIIVILISYYFFYKELILFFVFITSIVSLFVVQINSAMFARFNLKDKNTNYLLYISIIKFSLIYICLFLELNFYYSIILFNIILIISYFLYSVKLYFTTSGFSFLSVINNSFSALNINLDKLYASSFLKNIAAEYFIAFRASSVFQILTEIIYRDERFKITSGKKKIDFKILRKKFIFTSLIILITYSILNIPLHLYLLKIENIFFISSFYKILYNLKSEILLISFAFLLNAYSGVKYDYIYKFENISSLLIINFLNLIIFILLLFLSKDSLSLALIFFIVQVSNYVFISLNYYHVSKNIK